MHDEEDEEELVWCSLPVEVEVKKPQESKFTNTKDHYLHDPQDPSNWEIWEREVREREREFCANMHKNSGLEAKAWRRVEQAKEWKQQNH
jgi:hypothetical protein